MRVLFNMRSRLASSAARAFRSRVSSSFLSSRTLTSTSCSRRYAVVGALVEYERACSSLLKDVHAQSSFWPHGLLTSLRLISSSPVILHQEIGMPSLSPTMTQGNIAKWCKKEGDQVAPGDVLCEIETDKATLEMEAMEEGFLAKILCPDGSKDIPVGQAIAVVVDSEEEIGNFKDYKATSGASFQAPSPPPKSEKPSETEASKSSTDPSPKAEASKPTAPSSEDRIFASPLARKIAEEKKVPLSSLQGTGPDGRIIKSDIEEFIKSDAPGRAAEKPLQSLDYTDIPNTQIRKITAQRLLQSKQTIPHYYLTVDTRVDNLLALRSKLNSLQEASGGKRISINDFVLKVLSIGRRLQFHSIL